MASDHEPDYIGHDTVAPDGSVVHQEIRCGAQGADRAGVHTCTKRPGHDGSHQEGAWQFFAGFPYEPGELAQPGTYGGETFDRG